MLQVISQTVELLVHACSSSDHHIRLSASENLKKMIKVYNKNNEHFSESVHIKLQCRQSAAATNQLTIALYSCNFCGYDVSLQNLMNVHLSRLQQDLFHELKKVMSMSFIPNKHYKLVACTLYNNQ